MANEVFVTRAQAARSERHVGDLEPCAAEHAVALYPVAGIERFAGGCARGHRQCGERSGRGQESAPAWVVIGHLHLPPFFLSRESIAELFVDHAIQRCVAVARQVGDEPVDN
jgi:hypothetical protein